MDTIDKQKSVPVAPASLLLTPLTNMHNLRHYGYTSFSYICKDIQLDSTKQYDLNTDEHGYYDI